MRDAKTTAGPPGPTGSDREKEAGECNADAGHPCDANDGEPCAACAKWRAEEEAFFHAMWRFASREERDPEGYQRDMIDAGRGHLLPLSSPVASGRPEADAVEVAVTSEVDRAE